jgi:1-acyl-sn-glycerol-3-phosphate acyltransferase
MNIWAVAVGVVAALVFVYRWRRSGQEWFDFLELNAMYLFARLWHGCASSEKDPLPATGPVLVIANHPCHADPAFLLANCSRPLGFLQARECYEVFLLRRLFRRVGCIPVARTGRDISGIRTALRRLREGAALCVFPEGEVTPPDSVPARPVKSGAALLALHSRAPVFPAFIGGCPRNYHLLGAWLWPSRGVRVIFGPAVDLSAYLGRPIERRLLEEVTRVFMRSIDALRPEAQALKWREDRQPACGAA